LPYKKKEASRSQEEGQRELSGPEGSTGGPKVVRKLTIILSSPFPTNGE
jgi:hypothetical protein